LYSFKQDPHVFEFNSGWNNWWSRNPGTYPDCIGGFAFVWRKKKRPKKKKIKPLKTYFLSARAVYPPFTFLVGHHLSPQSRKDAKIMKLMCFLLHLDVLAVKKIKLLLLMPSDFFIPFPFE